MKKFLHSPVFLLVYPKRWVCGICMFGKNIIGSVVGRWEKAQIGTWLTPSISLLNVFVVIFLYIPLLIVAEKLLSSHWTEEGYCIETGLLGMWLTGLERALHARQSCLQFPHPLYYLCLLGLCINFILTSKVLCFRSLIPFVILFGQFQPFLILQTSLRHLLYRFMQYRSFCLWCLSFTALSTIPFTSAHFHFCLYYTWNLKHCTKISFGVTGLQSGIIFLHISPPLFYKRKDRKSVV